MATLCYRAELLSTQGNVIATAFCTSVEAGIMWLDITHVLPTHGGRITRGRRGQWNKTFTPAPGPPIIEFKHWSTAP